MTIDSDIEQQLAEDNELFLRMAQGVEDDEVETEEVEVPAEPELEVEEDDPMEEQVEYEAEEEDDSDGEQDEDTPPEKQKTVSTKLYTPEEIKELLTVGDFSRIDTSRLSEEGKLVMKSMQSGLTPKLQEAAELRREMQALRESVEKSIPKPKPKDIYEAYEQDGPGTINFINGKIDELIDAGADQRDILRLQELRGRLRDHVPAQPQQQPVEAANTEVAVNAAKLLRAIPDIETKQMKLRDYAIEVMGYSPEELAEATSLTRGEPAIREIVRINNAYQKYTAPKRAEQKSKRKVPTKVEQGGGGFDQQKTTIKDRISSAKKSGDWMDVFLAMEED